MAIANTDSTLSKLAMMPDQALQQMAMMHKADPYMLPLIISEDTRRKQTRAAAQAQAQGAEPPKVVEEAIAGIGQLPPPQPPQGAAPPQGQPGVMPQRPAMPPSGAPQVAPRPGMPPPGMAQQGARPGAPPQQGAPRPPGIGGLPPQRLAKGGVVGYAEAGQVEDPFEAALRAEGITDPRQIAYLRALYAQESASGKIPTMSNRGAVGGMQIIPSTFKGVAEDDWDINDPTHNARAGIRYGLEGLKAAGGDPALAGAYYYGGPKGLAKAREGIARRDPKNPKAPDTLGYGASIAKRMAALMPVGSANASVSPTDEVQRSSVDQIPLQDGTLITPAQKEKLRWESQFQGMDPEKGFGRWLGEDVLGMKRDTTRQIANTLNAVAPLALPASAAMSGAGGLSRLARGAAMTPALASSATPTALGEKIGQALPDAAPTKVAGISALNPDANEAFRASERDYTRSQQQTPEALPSPDKAGQEALVDAAKAVTPKSQRKGMSNDDWLMLGLQLLSNKSPRFLTALGESGIATLQARKGREKDELDARKGEADIDKDKSMAEYYRANAKSLGINNKDLTAALAEGNRAYDDWSKSMPGQIALLEGKIDPVAKRNEFIQAAMRQYGVAGAGAGTASYASTQLPPGVKVTRK